MLAIVTAAKNGGGSPCSPAPSPRGKGRVRCKPLACASGAVLLLAACGGAAHPPAPRGGAQFYAISSTASASPTATAAPTLAATPRPVPAAPPTPTPGPIAFVLDAGAERRDVTMHVGQRVVLALSHGIVGDWISGVDDARVLAPVSSAANGIYQAMQPGVALLTAHIFLGCASVVPAEPCRPEQGFWFQTQVTVLP